MSIFTVSTLSMSIEVVDSTEELFADGTHTPSTV